MMSPCRLPLLQEGLDALVGVASGHQIVQIAALDLGKGLVQRRVQHGARRPDGEADCNGGTRFEVLSEPGAGGRFWLLIEAVDQPDRQSPTRYDVLSGQEEFLGGARSDAPG